MGISIEKSREFVRKQAKSDTFSKSDELILSLICIHLELKLAWLAQELEQTIVEGRLSTFIGMEAALLTEKQLFTFYTAFKAWLPRVCKFSYACIMFYDPQGIAVTNMCIGDCLIGINDAVYNESQLRFPMSLGLTATSLKKGKMIIGTTTTKHYEAEIDNFANFPQIANFLLVPLINEKGIKLGVAQFYNCRSGEINENIIVRELNL